MSLIDQRIALAKIGLAFFLSAGLIGLLALFLLCPVALGGTLLPLVSTALGTLGAAFIFAVHAIFAVPHPPAEDASFPTPPAQPAPNGVK